MHVVPVPVREDNYAYLLVDEPTKRAAAVDPYDVNKVEDAAGQLGISIVAAIITHHHFDHSGGNQEFARRYPGAPIYGGSDQVPHLTNLVKDKDEFVIGDNVQVKCMATPCHTQDSICYYVTDSANKLQPGGVFTGDTLFIGGCGRFFEGVGADMHAALSYLGTLPDETVTYVGHEYTAGNARFGRHAERLNRDIERLVKLVEQNKITTGKSTIGDEKTWNVFMRPNSKALREFIGVTMEDSDSAVVTKLREMKDAYRG